MASASKTRPRGKADRVSARKCTLRLASIIDQLPACEVERLAGLLERVIPEIPKPAFERDAELYTASLADRIIGFIALISTLNVGEIGEIQHAVADAVLDGVLRRNACGDQALCLVDRDVFVKLQAGRAFRDDD